MACARDRIEGTISARPLTRSFGGLSVAASTLGFSSVEVLQEVGSLFCAHSLSCRVRGLPAGFEARAVGRSRFD